MGNTIVIPSSNDWYTQPLKKHGITLVRPILSGTFFLAFEGKDSNDNHVFVKAYEYIEPLNPLQVVKYSMSYFEKIQENSFSTQGIANYSRFWVQGNRTFLVRKKFDRCLSDVVTFQQPKLEIVEKKWMAFQICMCLSGLHSIGLVHGDLKPSNIFVLQTGQVVIADPAPYKPSSIPQSRPNLYYHFFTTGNTEGFYLAPERFTDNPTVKIDKQSDLFSLGCLIAFIFLDGKHLFDITTLPLYAEGKYGVESTLSSIKSKKIRQLIMRLISPEPSDRPTLSSGLFTVFSQEFKALHDIIRSFEINGSFNVKNDGPKIMQVASIDKDIYKLIVLNFMSAQIHNIRTQSDIIFYVLSFCDFVSDLPANLTLLRALPTIVYLLETGDPTIDDAVLRGITKLLGAIPACPRELTPTLTVFLANRLHSITRNTSDSRVLRVFTDHLPRVLIELHRLLPTESSSLVQLFSDAFQFREISHFRTFSNSMKALAPRGSFTLDAFFYYVLAAVNQPEPEYAIEVLSIFLEYYRKAKPSELRQHSIRCKDSLMTICGDICARDPPQILREAVLSFILEATELGVLDDDVKYETAQIIIQSNVKGYYKDKLIEYLPKDIQNDMLPEFCINYEANSDCESVYYESRHSHPPLFQVKEPSTPKKLRGRFLSSTKINSSVSELIKIGSDRVCIAVEGDSRLSWLELENGMAKKIRSKLVRGTITGCCGIGDEDAFAVGFDSGTIERFDAKTGRASCSISAMNPTCLTDVGNGLIIASTNNGLSICDMRSQETISLGRGEMYGQIKSIAEMRNGSLYAIGYSAGVVSLLDLRIGKPVHVMETPSVEQIVSIPHNYIGGEGFLVVGEGYSSVVEVPRMQWTTRIVGNVSVAISYDEGAILLDPYSSSYVTTREGQHSLMVFDNSDPIAVPETRVRDYILLDPSKSRLGNSVHMHASKVTSVINCGHLFVSGDTAGFVNTWRIE